MKGYLKRTASVLLTVSMLFCAAISFDMSAFAQESSNTNTQDKAVQATEEPSVSAVTAETTTEPLEEQATVPETTVMQDVHPTEAEPTVQPTTAVPAPSVGKVTGIVKTSKSTDSITLEWNKTSGATGYVIYYMNADKSNTYTKLAYVKTNKCTIKNLSHTTSYYFKIAAYVEKNGKKYEGSATLKKTATQPAAPNPSLKRSSNILEFSWSKNAKATGYKIYRASGSTNGKYVLYKTIKNNSTTSFADKNVESGRAYYYRVMAYRNLYTKDVYNSEYGEIKFISGLNAINYSMTSQLSRVSFTWNKNRYATGYDIYYATSKNGTYKKLGTTRNDYFNTVRLSNNKTYYFRIQPYKLNGASKTKIVGTYSTKSMTVTNKAYGKNIGNTYIEISLKEQHMWFYINGDLYCHTDVVTGNNDGYHNTTKGAHKIFQRKSPAVLVGDNYETPVNFWLGFTHTGIGIHDSTWRPSSDYGGNTYKGNGSHGCVNTPYNAVKKIYQKARIGNYVVVY